MLGIIRDECIGKKVYLLKRESFKRVTGFQTCPPSVVVYVRTEGGFSPGVSVVINFSSVNGEIEFSL